MIRPLSFAVLASAALAGQAFAADMEAGKMLAEKGNQNGALACLSCHGVDGAGMAAANFPRLAGLDAGYLAKQLNDFKAGTRSNPVMKPHADALSATEINDVAAYYAQLQAPVAATSFDPALLKRGQELVVDGNWAIEVPPCQSCHGPDATGSNSAFPSLAGQHADYITSQLKAWQGKSPQRSNDPNNMMKVVADRMSDEDIKAVSAYLASLNSDGTPTVAALAPTQKHLKVINKKAPKKPAKLKTPKFDLNVVYMNKHRKGWLKKGGAENGVDHTPPDWDKVLADLNGKNPAKKNNAAMVVYGRELFNNTQLLRNKNVGNNMNCKDCHLGSGLKATTAPIYAAQGTFPAFRGKNKHVNSIEERIAGCFTYSMNGTPPEPRSKEMMALMSYHAWSAKGLPIGATVKNRGYAKLDLPKQTPDFARGETVYKERCAVCHGDNGEGYRAGDKTAYPALWGDMSYNFGAGMHRVSMAANFIKAAMPLGNTDLTEQEAWDVAMFINSQERPQEPRWKGSVEKTWNAHHKHADCLYGIEVDGKILGDTGAPKPKPGQPGYKEI